MGAALFVGVSPRDPRFEFIENVSLVHCRLDCESILRAAHVAAEPEDVEQ